MIGIGINTGTSADAIDVVVAEFGRTHSRPSVKLLWSGAYRYPAGLKRLFLELVDFTATLTPSTWFDMAGRFDFGLGMAFSDAVEKTIRASGIRKSAIAFIGSHGQTVWHSPAPAGHSRGRLSSTGSTIQLGSPSVTAVRTGIPVVAHFRDKDIALGGQGAPLAPVLHFELFRKYAPAVVLNIGGIANITVLPSQRDFSRVYGFDTGPGNRLIDIAAEAYTNGRQSFDRDGRIAGRGVADANLLSVLLQDRFIRRHPPKSTGREHYNKTYLTMQSIRLDDVHTVATVTALTARSIAYNIEHFVKPPIKNIIVCGGGSYNRTILKHLSGLVHGADIKTAEDLGYNAYAIEPLLFAYLGYLGFNTIPVSFKNITGSTRTFVPGGVYYP